MTLSNHIDPDALEEEVLSQNHKLVRKYVGMKNEHILQKNSQWGETRNASAGLSNYKLGGISIEDKYRIPESGMDETSSFEAIHDDLALDGTPVLNLASFVNTHISDTAEKLINENLVKNLADNDEYPIMQEFHQRCISILANLWNAPKPTNESGSLKNALGTATTGSSEAIMLGGLAMKKRWQARRRSENKDPFHPNIIMSSCCQVALEKFARYFDVEARIIPVDPKSAYLMDLSKLKENVDENTIGVFVIEGSTYTGGFEDVEKVNAILDEIEKEKGWNIPIHVDGASGGFVAPFLFPNLKWDFRVPRVCSINASGHKFGLVSAGLGWVVFRDQSMLPQELKFELRYLGGIEESFTLNFSRPGFQVIHQYFNFLSLGKEGFYSIFDNCMTNARILSRFLEETGHFHLVSNLHLPKEAGAELEMSDHEGYYEALPVVSFQFSEKFRKTYPGIPQAIMSTMLRKSGWIVPNYPLPHPSVEPEKDDNVEILRVVVRYNLALQLLDKLMRDIVKSVQVLTDSCDLIQEKMSGDNSKLKEAVMFNMLSSVALDGESSLIAFKDPKGHKGSHKHVHHSFRGTC